MDVRRIEAGEGERLRVIRLAALRDAPDAFRSLPEHEEAYAPEVWEQRGRTVVIAQDGDDWLGMAGLYADDEVPVVRAFAERVLTGMGRDGLWIGNFASEAVKASNANVLIQTTATRVEGGWELSGEKSFGCLTGTADYYLVTARRADLEGMDSLSLFLVDRTEPGVRNRTQWNGLGMRASANHGIVLDGAFVIREDGVVLAAGRYLSASEEDVKIPLGLGARHAASAGITSSTKAIALVVSQTSGAVRLFKDGNIVLELHQTARRT